MRLYPIRLRLMRFAKAWLRVYQPQVPVTSHALEGVRSC